MRSSVLPLLLAGGIALAVSACHPPAGDLPRLAQGAASGDRRAATRLVKAMGDPDRETSLAAYRAVLSLGETCVPQLLEGLAARDPALFEACAAALANLNQRKAVPALEEALAGGGEKARISAWALGMLESPTSVPILARALSSPAADQRRAAVRSLVRIGPATAPEVEAALRGASDPGTERAAIRVLGEIRGRGAVPLLLAIQGENRDAAIWALGRIADPRAVSAVLVAMTDGRWQVRREAAQALGSLGDRASVPALTRALSDPETVVREWAARSLQALTGSDVLYRDEEGKMVPPYNLYR